MRNAFRAMLVASLLLLSGCALTPPKWHETGTGSYAPAKQGYSVNLPPGWMEFPIPDATGVTLSFNGPDLNYIVISRRENDKVFKVLDKTAAPGELPADLASDYIALLKKEGNAGLQVISNEPADFGGGSGFHLIVEYSTQTGLRYRLETYGACTASGFYTLVYRAPVLYYYDVYHPAFKSAVDSFRFSAKTD